MKLDYLNLILDDAPIDGTNYIITTCLNGLYTKREITTPFDGELTLLEVTENITFNTIPEEDKPLTLYKKDKTVITVVDSRTTKTNWKLYIYFVKRNYEFYIESKQKVNYDNTLEKIRLTGSIFILVGTILLGYTIFKEKTPEGEAEVA